MKKITISILSMLALLLFSFSSISQKKMMWTTKSQAAKDLALKGANHMLNAEFAEGYQNLSEALKLDPDFTVALVLMSNLTVGETKKAFTERALKSSTDKTDGEKLFASLSDPKNTQEKNRDTWAKLHEMFPDGEMIGDLYAQTRATPEEQFAAAQDFIKKFPNHPAMYNTIAYYYMNIKKDTAMAKQNFEKYISLYPDGCNPYDSMGEYYLNTGDMENAKKYYTMALEKYPFNISSINALQKMKDSNK